MDWCDLSELREASGQYAQLIQHNTFGRDAHTHEDVERLHNAINNVVLSEIGNVLARYNVNRTRVIQLIETTKDIIANLKKLIGDNMHTIFKCDPDVGSVFKFCEDFDNAIREEYSKLLLRRNTDPTDGDVQANERLQLFYNGCYGNMRLEDFIYKHILNDNNGTCITVGGATFANIRRLNYLIEQCQDEQTKTIMEEIKENISIMIHLTSPLEDEFDEFESCDTIGQKKRPNQNSKTKFDADRLGSFFNAIFKGSGNNYNHFADLVDDIKTIKVAKELAMIAVMIYDCKQYFIKKPSTFATWLRQFFEIIGRDCPKDTRKSKYKPNDTIKSMFYYLK